MTALLEKLEALECPVNWNLERVNKVRGFSSKDRINDKLTPYSFVSSSPEEPPPEEIEADGSSAWQKCSQMLTLSWHEYPDTTCMRKVLGDMENFIAGNPIPLITRYTAALKYLVNSMWAHVYYKEDNTQKAEEYLQSLDYDALDTKDKAAVMALKSCVYMEFGPVAFTPAHQAIKQALELEDSQAEWHFLIGKCLSRTRRAQNHKSSPSDEELHHLRKAVDLDQTCASHFVFCAQSVKEFGQNSILGGQEHMEECEELLRKAAQLGDLSPTNLGRIAKALMNFEGGFGAELLEYCVHRSLELLPGGGQVNHVAGNFYEFRKKDNVRAAFYYEKAMEKDVYGACINLIDLKWRTSSEDIEPLVNSFWQQYRHDELQRIKALPVMAYFKFFVKNDLVESINYWKEWMHSRTGEFYTDHLFVRCHDFTKRLVGEILSVLESNSQDLLTDHEDILRGFLSEVREARPDLDITRRNSYFPCRQRVIQSALGKLKPPVRAIVEPKLPVTTPRTRSDSVTENRQPASSWAIGPPMQPWRREREAPRPVRELPQNWRES